MIDFDIEFCPHCGEFIDYKKACCSVNDFEFEKLD